MTSYNIILDRNFFYAFGELKSVVVVHKSKCAFINYATRSAAELAVERAYNNCNIKGHVLRVQWGKPRPQGPRIDMQTEAGPSAAAGAGVSGQISLDQLLEMPVLPPPPGSAAMPYASQDPSSFGTSSRDYRA